VSFVTFTVRQNLSGAKCHVPRTRRVTITYKEQNDKTIPTWLVRQTPNDYFENISPKGALKLVNIVMYLQPARAMFVSCSCRTQLPVLDPHTSNRLPIPDRTMWPITNSAHVLTVLYVVFAA